MIGLRKFLVAVLAVVAVVVLEALGADTDAYAALGGIVSVYFGGQALVDRVAGRPPHA